ncbi:MAG: hypothetical protein KatS3mg052_0358 [Candidatus Roseilinea sp.]|nr:MAG: hypothetical protein KatS3mg052_0358 [Candidatus Roseilinea sp.]
MANPVQLNWTREALERLYDLAFLEQHITLPPAAGKYASGYAAQRALVDAIQRLKPAPSVPRHSVAWRVYNVLHERYVSGLTQAEAAEALNMSLRQLRRDQMRAVVALAALLFDVAEGGPVTMPTSDRPRSQLTSIKEALRSALATLGPVMAQHGVHVDVRIEGSPLPVVGDRMVIRQLLILALNWVIQPMQQERLEIRITSGGQRVQLSLPVLGTRQNEGDLDAVRTLAEGIGVQVWQRPAALELSFPTSARHCVLMVDDDPDAIALVRRSLEVTDEFDLVAVTHPELAVRDALEIRPACILLDVMMPVVDGWELLTQLKAHAELATTPIIVSSVLGSETLARALGASAVLPRPFRADVLRETLRAVIYASSTGDSSR